MTFQNFDHSIGYRVNEIKKIDQRIYELEIEKQKLKREIHMLSVQRKNSDLEVGA